MDVAEQCRAEGNQWFGQGKIDAAVTAYECGIRALQDDLIASSSSAAAASKNDAVDCSHASTHTTECDDDTVATNDTSSVRANDMHCAQNGRSSSSSNSSNNIDICRRTDDDHSTIGDAIHGKHVTHGSSSSSSSSSSVDQTRHGASPARIVAPRCDGAHSRRPCRTPAPHASQPPTAAQKLLAILHANLAYAQLTLGRTSQSCTAAQIATTLDPFSVKAWLRYVEARRADGYAFDALVRYLQHVRPLLRTACERQACAAREADALTRPTESALCEALSLSRLDAGIELVDGGQDGGGGLSLISRRRYAANEVLFVERKYTRCFESVHWQPPAHRTTERIAMHFAQLLRDTQCAQTAEWARFRRDFVGAWPRALDEVDGTTRARTRAALTQAWPSMTPDERDEMLITALMCRFNCFYAGFFRVCALANHSCRANVAMKYHPETHTVTMITVCAIEPGTLLHVKYLSDAHFLLGLAPRRALLRSWEFWCDCVRCREDSAPHAAQEMRRCPGCDRFVHFAIPYAVYSDDDDDEEEEEEEEGEEKKEDEEEEAERTAGRAEEDALDGAVHVKNMRGLHAAVEHAVITPAVVDRNDVDGQVNGRNRAASSSSSSSSSSSISLSLSSALQCCTQCHTVLGWNDRGHRNCVKALLNGFRHPPHEGGAAALFVWLRGQLGSLAAMRVHPVHWMYRQLFYFTCVALMPIVAHTMRLLMVHETLFADAVGQLFAPCGLKESYTKLLRRCAAEAVGEGGGVRASAEAPSPSTHTRADASTNVLNYARPPVAGVAREEGGGGGGGKDCMHCVGMAVACADVDAEAATGSPPDSSGGRRSAVEDTICSCADSRTFAADSRGKSVLSVSATPSSRRHTVLSSASDPLCTRWVDREFDLPAMETGAAEVLQVFVVLWHMIVDFYPAYEMWAIHHAMCDLVLIHILVSDRIAVPPAPSLSSTATLLSSGAALALLQRHGPYLGATDATSWIHTLQAHRKMLANSAKHLPSLAQLKQAFKSR